MNAGSPDWSAGRFRVLLLAISGAFAAIVGTIVHDVTDPGNDLQQWGDRLSLVRDHYRLPWGRIYSADDVCLLQRQGTLRLTFTGTQQDARKAGKLLKRYRLELPGSADILPGGSWTFDEPAPGDWSAILALCRHAPGLFRARWVYRFTGAAGSDVPLRNALLERYRNVLQGTEGLYQVRRDKSGRWVPETFQILVPAEPGRDVHLDKSSAEILSGGLS